MWTNVQNNFGIWKNGTESYAGQCCTMVGDDGPKHISKGLGVYNDEKNDIVLSGEWEDNRANGYGVKLNCNKTYAGQHKNDILHGHGQLEIEGDIFLGEFKNDKKHGHGKLSFREGAVYLGQMEKDNIQGFGQMTYSNGDIHTGQWLSHKANGCGLKLEGHIYKFARWRKGYIIPGTERPVDLRREEDSKLLNTVQGHIFKADSAVIKPDDRLRVQFENCCNF
eukprot:m.346910 g.346910  ORF g.346910 m.346910 type:complete len:223 (-) comp30649_c0_seq1:33-701(-)